MAYNFKKKPSSGENQVDEKKDKELHGPCVAWGCNRMGHVHTGKWHCRYHFACHGKNIADQLSHVTIILKNHEPEVNWYEVLLSSSEVDWVCDGLGKRAPVGMEPSNGETFRQYRERIETHINSLLAFKVVKSDAIDRKVLASGDDSFRNFADLVPQF